MTREKHAVSDADVGQLSRLWADVFRRVCQGTLPYEHVRDVVKPLTQEKKIPPNLFQARRWANEECDPESQLIAWMRIAIATQDATDKSDVRELINRMIRRHGETRDVLRKVVHCALMADDGERAWLMATAMNFSIIHPPIARDLCLLIHAGWANHCLGGFLENYGAFLPNKKPEREGPDGEWERLDFCDVWLELASATKKPEDLSRAREALQICGGGPRFWDYVIRWVTFATVTGASIDIERVHALFAAPAVGSPESVPLLQMVSGLVRHGHHDAARAELMRPQPRENESIELERLEASAWLASQTKQLNDTALAYRLLQEWQAHERIVPASVMIDLAQASGDRTILEPARALLLAQSRGDTSQHMELVLAAIDMGAFDFVEDFMSTMTNPTYRSQAHLALWLAKRERSAED